MDRAELLARINSLARGAIGSDGSEVSTQRAQSLDRYYGRPLGNEIKGRSSVVSRDLAETINWALPSLVRLFLQSGSLAEFQPIGPDDEKQCEQESDYVNHVILNQNDGFLILHDWFKDALLLKNGYVKAWWHVQEVVGEEGYSGLTMDALTMLMRDYPLRGIEAEIVNQEEGAELDPLTGQPVPVFSVRVKTVQKKGRVCIEAVPAEEMRISKRARGDLNRADYLEHVTTKTRTELIEMGMDADFVNGLSASTNNDPEHDSEQDARRPYDDTDSDEAADSSMDLIDYREVYLMVDFDGDGRAERRRVIIVGEQIPEGDEWNRVIEEYAISYLTPWRMAHTHVGQSMDDLMADLSEIKTVLQRAMLDNTYGLVNQEWIINNKCDPEDFLVSRPLGVKFVDTDGPVDGMFSPIVKPNILDKVLPVIDYVDTVKSHRTGVKPEVSGVDPDVLQNMTKGAFLQNLTQANAILELMARLFAEIGVKDLVRKVHGLLLRYQDYPAQVKLRGSWATVDPREWSNRDDMRISVGLGTGNKDELLQANQLIVSAQSQAAAMGLVGPKQAFNSCVDLAKALGKPSPDRYFLDPESQEYKQMMAAKQQQQQPNPLAEVEQIKQQSQQQIAAMKEQMATQRKEMELMMKGMLEAAEQQWKRAMDVANLEVRSMLGKREPTDLGKPGIGQGLQAQ